jgi:hypothetical protein
MDQPKSECANCKQLRLVLAAAREELEQMSKDLNAAEEALLDLSKRHLNACGGNPDARK